MNYSKFRLRTFTQLESKYFLQCGSTAELPINYDASNSTDIDMVFYCCDICAIPWNRNPPKKFNGTLLRIESNNTPPEFVKLRLDQYRIHDEPTYYRRPRFLNNIETGGPSIKETRKHTNCFMADTVESFHDLVYAVYCPYWPPEVEEWRMRKRIHGWPDEKLIARIAKGGCHFVSKLRIWSTCDDTEWRFSFSKAELILIHSWTSVQKRVYHVLRLTRMKILNVSRVDDHNGLHNYYIKTLMFWACEEKPREFWNEDNIGNCVNTLLSQLLDCLMERRCCHYFIPRFNIMSHLDDNVVLKKKLLYLLKHFGSQFASLFEEEYNFTVTSRSLHYYYMHSLNNLFPLNNLVNGRFGEYLSECEWFLPEMKFLHAAVEANLHLMSLSSITSRKESEYFGLCLDNFDLALIKNESLWVLNPDLSHDENMNSILRRKHLRNSFPVYRRCVPKHSETYDYEQLVKEYIPSPLYIIVASYRANLFFTALKDYKEAFAECDKCAKEFLRLTTLGPKYIPEELIVLLPILISNSLSPMFDEHLQVILGFVTLHKYFSLPESSNSSSVTEVCLKVNCWEYLKYLSIQCEQQLPLKATSIGIYVENYLDTVTLKMSQLTESQSFSAVILYAALRQSGAYTEPMVGCRIPFRSGHVATKLNCYNLKPLRTWIEIFQMYHRIVY